MKVTLQMGPPVLKIISEVTDQTIATFDLPGATLCYAAAECRAVGRLVERIEMEGRLQAARTWHETIIEQMAENERLEAQIAELEEDVERQDEQLDNLTEQLIDAMWSVP